MKKLSNKDKRVLLGGGAFVVVVLAVFYGILPFLESTASIREELAGKEKMLGQSVKLLRNEERFREQSKTLDRELERLSAQLLEARSTALAQNQLETIVRELAEQNGVSISRSTPMQERQAGERYSKVTIEINVQSGMAELASFLHALSTHPKYLEVENFFVNSFQVRGEIRLQPRMRVSAYIRLSEG